MIEVSVLGALFCGMVFGFLAAMIAFGIILKIVDREGKKE